MNDVRSGFYFVQEVPAITDPIKPLKGSDQQALVSTLFIYHKGEAYSKAMQIPSRSLRLLFTKLGGFHEYRRYLRSFEYMKELIQSRFGNIEPTLMHDLSTLPSVDIPRFNQFVFLWPDANGMGWSDVERKVFNRKQDGASIYVLTGRRRFFELTKKEWRAFRIRRFLEKTFLLEFGVLVIFLATAPLLALWDGMTSTMRRSI